MNKKLKEKITESFSSVFPITAIVLILSVVLVPMPISTLILFLFGAALLIVGMGFFTLGADMAMMPMGEEIGVQVTRSKKLWIVVAIGFLIGFIVTIAEPDLQVLANQVPSIPNAVLLITVAVGVGIFLVVSILRILFQIKLSTILIVLYSLVFFVSIFTPNNFVSVAFDSGGVTTGPITVPFIMALGVGIASVRSDKNSQNDSFGLVSLSSVGPVLAVLILGIVFNPKEASYTKVALPEVGDTQDVFRYFAHELPHYIKEVFIALVPILIFFLLFQLLTKRFKKRELKKIAVGYLYTLVGLILFLTGVNVGFIPVGHLMGGELASSSYAWVLIPVAMVIGYFVVSAEPAVHVLNKQVEEISSGTISPKAMNTALSIGVSVALGLSMVRVLTGLSIYWILVPGYLIALLLTFKVKPIFVGIAFDSGGVVSGPMTACFLLPLAMGACEAIGGNVMTDAFGVVALIAMTPLIAIQFMGLLYDSKMKETPQEATVDLQEDNDIIEYEEEGASE